MSTRLLAWLAGHFERKGIIYSKKKKKKKSREKVNEVKISKWVSGLAFHSFMHKERERMFRSYEWEQACQ